METLLLIIGIIIYKSEATMNRYKREQFFGGTKEDNSLLKKKETMIQDSTQLYRWQQVIARLTL